jgi:hypothetical protein
MEQGMSVQRRGHYDSYTRQPQTLGELERWLHAAGVHRSNPTSRPPVPLDPHDAAIDRLRTYSVVNYVELLSVGPVRRIIGEYALDRGISMEAAELASLQDAADALAPMPRLERTRETEKEKVRSRRPPLRDKVTEARDKWIYDLCIKGEAYDTIARKLPQKNARWTRISTKQGILAAARRYAQRHELPPPPPRQNL